MAPRKVDLLDYIAALEEAGAALEKQALEREIELLERLVREQTRRVTGANPAPK